MMGGYYDRQGEPHPFDGGIVFASPEDEAKEEAARRFLEQKWNATINKFGKLTPVDWYILRHDHLAGVMEFKARSDPMEKYDTVFLNLRKWLALTMAHIGFGVPALFVAQWTNALGWINLDDVDANHKTVKYLGCNSFVKSHTDKEPVILIPTERFTLMPDWLDHD